MITIIVILILAGVTVATLTGENGLLSKTQLAKERTIEGEQDERDKLSSYENELDNYSTWERTGGNETVTISQGEYTLNTPSTKNQETAIITLDSGIDVVNVFGLIAGSVPINYIGTNSDWNSRTRIQDYKVYQQVAGYLNMSEVITIQYTKTPPSSTTE